MTKGRMLVIDDEVRLCKTMEEYFNKRGFDAKRTCDGDEAIEILRHEEFDIVLCDYIMPNVTGYDVARFLNEMKNKPKVGIITGWSELIRNSEKEEMDVDFIIKKPFDFEELEEQVNSVLGTK